MIFGFSIWGYGSGLAHLGVIVRLLETLIDFAFQQVQRGGVFNALQFGESGVNSLDMFVFAEDLRSIKRIMPDI